MRSEAVSAHSAPVSRAVPRLALAILLALCLAAVLGACTATSPTSPPANPKLRVVATTTIVGDVVKQIGGEWIDLTILLPVGADPHAFEATPQDAAKLAQAQIVFANGAGLEVFLDPLLHSAGTQATIVYVSEGIPLRQFASHEEEHAEQAEEHAAEGEAEHAHPQGDPHTWMTPHNVITWTHNIENALVAADPAHADAYRANAEAYRAQLIELDAWIAQQVAQIPPENRRLVTDHAAFGYFAQRYGFEQIGTVFPGYSTLAEPSAQELAALEEAIRAHRVKAVFVGDTVNPNLARRIAEDTGVQLVTLYTGSLTEPEGPAGTYLQYMRYNVSAIVEALR